MQLKSSLSLLFLLLPAGLAAQGKIELKEYDNKVCKKNKAYIASLVSRCTDIEEAERLIKAECGFTPANHYILYCKTCPPDKMIRKKPSRDNEFKNQTKNNMNGLISKGDNKIFNLIQFRALFADSLAVFDSLLLDISGMTSADRKKAENVYFRKKGSEKKIFPAYDKQNGILIISKAMLGDDGNMLNACYTEDTKEKGLPGVFSLFFITTEEKKELALLAADLKECDEAVFTDPAGMEYLQNIISGKYKKVDSGSLSQWITTLKL
ncbi:MAG TPA: hypothetical protein PKC54_14145 [Ferruginibacter sp.]|nr:hypothetical protein [Ferruginibacter sp.]